MAHDFVDLAADDLRVDLVRFYVPEISVDDAEPHWDIAVENLELFELRLKSLNLRSRGL